MNRSVEITENTFFSIFSDAILLYELASKETDKKTQNTLAKSSILSVNYALEAAANSFLTSIGTISKIKDNIDKFSTLDKFDFVLQWHIDKSLPWEEHETQIVQRLINQRNALVHPKVKTLKQDVNTTSGDENIAYHHKSPQDDSKEKCKVTKMSLDSSQYSAKDALIAIKALVNFLNKYIESWWGIDVKSSAILLMQSWTGSINASPIMFLKNELEIVLRNNKNLNIKFIGLYGLLDQFP